MTRWKLRPPDRMGEEFRILFEVAFRKMLSYPEEPDYSCGIFSSRKAAASWCDKFRCFRWLLRHYPMHPLAGIEEGWEAKLRKREVEGGIEVILSFSPRPDNTDLLNALGDGEDFSKSD